MNNSKITYIPTAVKRVIIVKLMKKLLGFLAPSFQHSSKRRAMAFKLYEDMKTFERELQRCVPMCDLQEFSGDMWSDLQKRQLPDWMTTALYSTLTYNPDKTKMCSSVTPPAPLVDEVREAQDGFKVGDEVMILPTAFANFGRDHMGEQFVVRDIIVGTQYAFIYGPSASKFNVPFKQHELKLITKVEDR